jgi:hypothetical protein
MRLRKSKKKRRLSEKKLYKKNHIKELYNFSIENNVLVGDEYTAIFEIEAFNIELLSGDEKDKLEDLFKEFYISLKHNFDIITIQVSKNYDTIKNQISEYYDDQENEYSKMILKKNIEFLDDALNQDIINVKYYLSVSFKEMHELKNINNIMSSTFTNTSSIRQLDNDEIKKLMKQLINFDDLDYIPLSIDTELERMVVGNDA